MLRFALPPRGSLAPNSDVDPLRYYYAPLVGRVFAARLEVGLSLLPNGRAERLLEIGYGAGLLMPTLAAAADVVEGIDLASDPHAVRASLARIGVRPARLERGSATALPFEDDRYDVVVAFSILEHLEGPALESAVREAARVLRPGGHLLVGLPAVHRGMALAFRAIGFHGIEDHHVSDVHAALAAARRAGFVVARTATLPRRVPLGWAPYNTALLRCRKPSAARAPHATGSAS